jgi:hypothetical protein
MKRLSLYLVVAPLFIACSDPEPTYQLVLENLPPNQTVTEGDTVRLYAIEYGTLKGNTVHTMASRYVPNYFEWFSSSPAVAEFISRGVLVARKAGQVAVTVSTAQSHGVYGLAVAVKPSVMIKNGKIQ